MNKRVLQKRIRKDGYLIHKGLLWKMVSVPEADKVAHKYGYVYVEELIRGAAETDKD